MKNYYNFPSETSFIFEEDKALKKSLIEEEFINRFGIDKLKRIKKQVEMKAKKSYHNKLNYRISNLFNN